MILLSNDEKNEEINWVEIDQKLKAGLKKIKPKDLVWVIAKNFKINKKLVYQRMLQLKADEEETSNKKTYQFGILAEIIAIIFLWLKGYQILKKRYKTFSGEVDIIAKKNKTLIAIEVKARRVDKSKIMQNGFLIKEVLGKKQQGRIKNAMFSFMKKNSKKYSNYSIRFDLIVICPFAKPLHFVNFWG